MSHNKYISSRGDRYGANYIPAISYIYLCHLNNVLLYHNCDKNCIKYKNNILHQYLEYKTSKTTDFSIIRNDIHKICCKCEKTKDKWPTKYITKEIFEKTGKAFPDIFHDSEIYNDIRGRYFDKKCKNVVQHIR